MLALWFSSRCALEKGVPFLSVTLDTTLIDGRPPGVTSADHRGPSLGGPCFQCREIRARSIGLHRLRWRHKCMQICENRTGTGCCVRSQDTGFPGPRTCALGPRILFLSLAAPLLAFTGATGSRSGTRGDASRAVFRMPRKRSKMNTLFARRTLRTCNALNCCYTTEYPEGRVSWEPGERFTDG